MNWNKRIAGDSDAATCRFFAFDEIASNNAKASILLTVQIIRDNSYRQRELTLCVRLWCLVSTALDK